MALLEEEKQSKAILEQLLEQQKNIIDSEILKSNQYSEALAKERERIEQIAKEKERLAKKLEVSFLKN